MQADGACALRWHFLKYVSLMSATLARCCVADDGIQNRLQWGLSDIRPLNCYRPKPKLPLLKAGFPCPAISTAAPRCANVETDIVVATLIGKYWAAWRLLQKRLARRSLKSRKCQSCREIIDRCLDDLASKYLPCKK